MSQDERILFDAGMFIGALLKNDHRHAEARPLVEAARSGDLPACTTIGILSEVYAALTWVEAQPPHVPAIAAEAVRLLIQPPSRIVLLEDGPSAAILMLRLAADQALTARRIHDARHAAMALTSEVSRVYTYDVGDWKRFESAGLSIVGPPSVLEPPAAEEPTDAPAKQGQGGGAAGSPE